MSQGKLLLGLAAAAAGGYWYYTQQQAAAAQDAAASASASTDGEAAGESACPEGYHLSPDGTECYPDSCPEGWVMNEAATDCLPLDGNPCGDGYELSADGTQCNPTGNPCGEGYVLSTDGKECLSTANPCGDGFTLSADGKTCDAIPGYGTLTGSELGDSFLYMGESVVAGEIYDWLGRKVSDVAERRAEQAAVKRAEQAAAKRAADKAAQEVAEAVAKEAADKAAKEGAIKEAKAAAKKALQSKAGKEAAEILEKRAAVVAEKQTAKRLSQIAGKRLAAKLAAMTAKMNAENSTVVGVLFGALTAVAMSVSTGLAASGTVFDKESPDDLEWQDVPEAARVAFEAIPGWGDYVSIAGEFLAFRKGCPPGTREENGLCYEPPKPGFECEAFLCYAHDYPGFSPLSETFAHMTKRIEMDTGSVPSVCPPGRRKDGALCYDDPGENYTVVGGVAWENCPAGFTDTGARCENLYGRGVGQLKQCPSGWTEDGLTCREDIHSEMDPCPEGSHDVAGTCWGKVGQVCGDDCSKGWDDCRRRGLFNECWGGCRESCSDVEGVTKGLAERNLRVWGGTVKGRGAGSDLPCPVGLEEGYDGLCYEACREGYRAEGLLCTQSFGKDSKVLAPHSAECGDGKVYIDGLCYVDPVPQGYTRKTLGLLDQNCPADKEEWKGYENFRATEDIGVSCQRATYTRKPFPIFSIYAKKRRPDPADTPDPPLPPVCSSVLRAEGEVVPEDQLVLCRATECGDGFDMSADGTSCIKRCPEGYSYNFATKGCERVLDDGTVDSIDNSDGVLSIEYDYR